MTYDWQILTLADIAEPEGGLVDGPFGSNLPASCYVEEGIPVIRGSNLTVGLERFKSNDFVYVSKETLRRLKRSECIPKDIIFTKKGTLGQTGIVPSDSHYERYLLSSNQMRLRVNTYLADPEYVYYWISSKASIEKIKRDSEYTGVPKINLDYLKKFPIVIPKLIVQKQISKILSGFEDKIDLNRQINSTLEQIAQILFKHWFIDFEFPDENGNPYISSGGRMEDSKLGEIPEGWRVGKLGELVNLEIGGNWGKDKEFEDSIPTICLRGTDLQKLKESGYSEEAPVRWVKKSSLQKRKMDSRDLLIAASGIGPIGRTLYISENIKSLYDQEIIYSNFTRRLRAKHTYEAIYAETVIETIYKTSGMASYISGTSIPNLDVAGLLKSDIIIPCEDLMKNYSRIAENLHSHLYKKENIILQSIRDSLLPKLMSGKIRVQT